MQIYDRVIPAASYPTLMELTCGVALAFVFEFMIRLARSSILDVLGKQAGLALSKRVFGRALRIRADARPARQAASSRNCVISIPCANI